MDIFIVEYQHKYGTDFWAAKSLQIAEEIIKTVQKHIFEEWHGGGWSLENAMRNWFEFSGNTEEFRITKIPLIRSISEAKNKSRA